MIKSDSITTIAGALAQLQGELKPVKMNQTNKFLGNSYADLGAIIENVRPLIAKYGLAIVQNVTGQGDQIGVETLLVHKSGEYIGGQFSLLTTSEKGKSAAQVAGSLITYARRYALAAILGLYTDEDADGNDPTKRAGKAAGPQVETMTLAKAEAITNRDGVRYKDIDSKQLAAMSASLDKAIKNNGHDPDTKNQLVTKLDAIGVILQSRSVAMPN